MPRTLEQDLFASGRKRILALDGGGVRGALTLSYLERMELLLGERSGDRNFRLCGYFDLIGVTSTESNAVAVFGVGSVERKVGRPTNPP